MDQAMCTIAETGERRRIKGLGVIRKAVCKTSQGYFGNEWRYSGCTDGTISLECKEELKTMGFHFYKIVAAEPKPKIEWSCHYCGCPATHMNFFGVPVCDDCDN